MTPKQLGILNALVTFAAENMPGGLSEDEREVAQIVGTATLAGDGVTRTHNYKVVNASFYKDIAEAVNNWADRGWRVAGVVSADTRAGYAHSIIFERPVDMSHPDD